MTHSALDRASAIVPNSAYPTAASENSVQHSVQPISKEPSSDISVPYSEAFCWRKTESLRFVMQIILSLAILSLCAGKLIFQENKVEKALYWGGITSVLAWWMPSPGTTKVATKDEQDKQNNQDKARE